MTSWYARRAFLVVMTLWIVAGISRGQTTILLRSGNGDVGGIDSRITFLSADQPAVPLRQGGFTAQDFEDARNGAPATIVAPNPYWAPALSDPLAQWIAVDADLSPRSALFSMDFEVEVDCWDSASLEIAFAVDDRLGDLPTHPTSGAST